MEILRVEHLSKYYGQGENEVRALDDVSFSVEKGQFLAIIGPSGSGKSTLLHILGGVDRPTSGKVYLENQDVFARNEEQMAIFRRRQVGLVYQFYNLIPVLNVTENMTLPVLLDGRKINRERLEDLMTTLKLHDRAKHLPHQLSGGQQQRVSIGRALMNAGRRAHGQSGLPEFAGDRGTAEAEQPQIRPDPHCYHPRRVYRFAGRSDHRH